MTNLDQLNARSQGTLPGLIGIEFTGFQPGRVTSRLTLRPELLAPNGYLHAAVVIAIADTTCGYGPSPTCPKERRTSPLSNSRATFWELPAKGRLPALRPVCTTDETRGKALALFRCTQLILYPREK